MHAALRWAAVTMDSTTRRNPRSARVRTEPSTLGTASHPASAQDVTLAPRYVTWDADMDAHLAVRVQLLGRCWTRVVQCQPLCGVSADAARNRWARVAHLETVLMHGSVADATFARGAVACPGTYTGVASGSVLPGAGAEPSLEMAKAHGVRGTLPGAGKMDKLTLEGMGLAKDRGGEQNCRGRAGKSFAERWPGEWKRGTCEMRPGLKRYVKLWMLDTSAGKSNVFTVNFRSAIAKAVKAARTQWPHLSRAHTK